MRKLRGKIVERRGKAFEKQVYDWSASKMLFTTFSNVGIGPRERLVATADFGDVDVLLIDHKAHVIFCLECKDMDAGRNPVEISSEIDRLIKGDPKKPSEPSRVEMHRKRMEWLEQNGAYAAKELGVPSGEWKLVPVVVTSEEIPSAFLGNSPIPIRALSRFERDSGKIWEELASGPHVRKVGT
jgi:hypothetical protein